MLCNPARKAPLGLLLAAALAGPALAQNPTPESAPRSVDYDYASRTFEIVDSTVAEAAGPATEVDTLVNDNFAFFGQALENQFRVIADHGFTQGSTGPVCEFVIAYSSGVPDENLDGVVDLEIKFYTGDAATIGDCSGNNYSGTGLGTEVASFVLTGLPGDDTPGDGSFSSWLITTDLRAAGAGSFLLPEGGVSWTYRALTGAPDVRALLVVPAASTCTPPASNPWPGTGDCIDSYTLLFGTSLSCLSTIEYATDSIASTWMKIVQDEAPAQPAVARFGTPPNAGTLTPIIDTAVVGCVGVDCPTVIVDGFPTFTNPAVDFWALSRTSTPSIPLAGIGTLLIGLPEILFLTAPPGTQLTVPSIPLACSFVGLEIFTQGGRVDASLTSGLTHALDFVIGTP